MGPIDLVMDVCSLSSAADAALWIAARFDVPSIPAHKGLAGATRARWRAGHERGLELMIRSGLWARLSEAAQAIAPVLLNVSEKQEPHHDEFTIQLSYRGIMRFSGIRSPNAVRKALLELRECGLLRSAATYRFSPPDQPMPLVLPQSYSAGSVVRIPTEPQTVGDHIRRRRLGFVVWGMRR